MRACAAAAVMLTSAASGLAANLPPAVEAIRLANEAAALAQTGNHEDALAKLRVAAELRPDSPAVLEQLAAAQAAAGELDAAIGTLERIAALGLALSTSLSTAEEFSALRPRPEFAALVKRFAANLHPKGPGEMAFALRGVTGLFEGIAWRRKTGEFYFGDVNGRAVWVRSKDGALRRLTADGDELLGVFGLALDEDNGTLWAATSAVPAMRGFSADQEGSAALAAIDLGSGGVREVIPLPRAAEGARHLLGDVALALDGSLFAPDSAAPILWRAAPGAETLEPFVESAEFLSLQGIAVLPMGVAILSDQVNGLLRVDLATRRVDRLAPPTDDTLVGLDGLVATPDGHVLGLQSGVRPTRVVRIELDGSAETVVAVKILESGHLAMAAPSLGCLGPGGDVHYVGNPGWNRFHDGEGRPSAPRAVPIFKTKLPKAPR